jgi:hypothetical protein
MTSEELDVREMRLRLREYGFSLPIWLPIAITCFLQFLATILYLLK